MKKININAPKPVWALVCAPKHMSARICAPKLAENELNQGLFLLYLACGLFRLYPARALILVSYAEGSELSYI